MRVSASACLRACVPACLVLGGCGGTAVPRSTQLTLPDDTVIDAQIGSGAPSLANTEWLLFRTSDDLFMMRIEFDENGALIQLTDNRIVGEDVFGDAIIMDGRSYPTNIDGLSYFAATYGVENESGFSFQVRAQATMAGLTVGTGDAFAVGRVEEDGIMRGRFGFRTNATGIAASVLPDAISPNTREEFDFYGTPAED